ncbi:hypothetical protein OB955_21360 [Halobacteria archaeon AArc-m2/3/4]|uniref:Uncharacterized protein n=1 Tax=Natronoglomus mannanivorans TaxID=2979990 RepID=A0AAP3E516_9EURY|nr:hypothetical protein [Halobacteria archaeon AArc-xg1-1]MCU4975254.1 hypothetical protein [Halobacteria archaeon AArc-m2/3/4]
MYPLLLFDALPWWLAAPLLQLGLLVAGMALDETYVNRATVLAGALALAVHAVVAGSTGLMVGLYLDIGLVVGVYGLYAYVVDAYVDNWFRIAAYFLYSPLAVFLVILLPDVVFPIAIVAAGYANLQLMAYLEPNDPYYFGPGTPTEFADAVADVEAESGDGTEAETETSTNSSGGATRPDGESESQPDPEPDPGTASEVTPPGAEPTAAGADSTERGILPEFMRRL